MESLLKRIESKLSQQALSIIANMENDEDNVFRDTERLKLNAETEKMSQISRELELKVSLTERETDKLADLLADLEQRLSDAKDIDIKDTAKDVQIKKKRLQSIKLQCKEVERTPTVDVVKMEEMHKEIVELQHESAEIDKELDKYKGLSPDPIVARRQVDKLRRQINQQKAQLLHDLQSDVSKLSTHNATMQ